jgi:hypothetical protein
MPAAQRQVGQNSGPPHRRNVERLHGDLPALCGRLAVPVDTGWWTTGLVRATVEADPFSSRRCSIVEQTQHETSSSQECPDCHALAADLEAHKQWHSRLVHDIATAVDRDVKRRAGAQ